MNCDGSGGPVAYIWSMAIGGLCIPWHTTHIKEKNVVFYLFISLALSKKPY